jgi:hypothetical protein
MAKFDSLTTVKTPRSGPDRRSLLMATVFEARQKDKGEDWTRNDRLIAIATHAQLHNTVKNLADLRPHLLEEIKQFFVSYNKLRNRKFKPLRDAGPREARELVEAGIKVFNNHKSKHDIDANK